MWFLAMVGLIAILWLISKAFNKVGDTLNKIGDVLADIAASGSRSVKGYGNGGENKNRTIEKIKTLKGQGTDEEYRNNVLKEIDDLTKE